MAELTLEFETRSGAVSPESISLVGFTGREELGRPYEYELELEVDADGGLGDDVLDDLLKRPCRMTFGSVEGLTEVHGLLRSIRVPTTHRPRPTRYVATLVPRLWAASQTQRSRIFQNLDLAGITRVILNELGLEEERAYTLALSKSYPTSEYTVQYQESDLDFLHRQLEHFGAYYYFVQEPDGERVVFVDSNAGLPRLEHPAPIPYAAREDGGADGVTALGRTLTPKPAGVVLREYNWRTPSIQLQSEAPADQDTGRGFFNEYGQHFKDLGAGAALAAVRAEELVASRDLYDGRTNVTALCPGHRAEVSGHPLLGFDKEYVVTSITHEAGERSLAYDKSFTAIPATVAFRSARRTPRPKIEGVMHGRVDGAVPGTAAPIDEYGRYKILFPFDLAGEPGGKATRWVRLAQPASGAGYGIHFPLHIGAEVAVAHLDGDPDRPIIMNSPPNAETLTPVRETNATQSQIITQTGIRLTWDDDC